MSHADGKGVVRECLYGLLPFKGIHTCPATRTRLEFGCAQKRQDGMADLGREFWPR